MALVCCACAPVTELVVELDAEPGARSRARTLEVEVTDGTGRVVRPRSDSIALEGRTLPIRFGLIPDQSQSWTFEALLLNERGRAFSRVYAAGQYRRDEVDTLRLTFEDRPLAVSSGNGHTCVLREGQVACVGRNEAGELGAPIAQIGMSSEDPVTLEGEFHRLAAGITSSCAIGLEGDVSCWGTIGGATGEARDPLGLTEPAARIAVSDDVVCAVSENGSLFCEGPVDDARLGRDAMNQQPLTGVAVSEVDVAGLHACALTTDGAVHCWGSSTWGEVPGGSSSEPVELSGGHRAISVGSGDSALNCDPTYFGNTCAIEESGRLRCWGLRFWGLDGAFSAGAAAGCGVADEGEHVDTATTWQSISVGGGHACGIREGGELYCFGRNTSGQVGTGDTEYSPQPTRIRPDLSWRSVDCGRTWTCAVTQDGALFCWGDNEAGQLGFTSNSFPVSDPTEVLWASSL